MQGWMDASRNIEELRCCGAWDGDPPIAIGDERAASVSRDGKSVAVASPGSCLVISVDEIEQLHALVVGMRWKG